MAKHKVSLSLDTAVMAVVDEEVGGSWGSSRSAVVQRVLRIWIRQRRKRALDDAVESYYQTRSDGEAAEDEAWAGMAADSLLERWNDA